MGEPVIITRQAIDDLRVIALYIARDDPDMAVRFGDILIDTALGISGFPEKGRVVPEFGDPSIREIVLGSYRIVYRRRATPAHIEILRFWHAARGIPRI